MVIGKKVRHYLGEAFALLLSLIVLIPLYMLFIGSFKNSAEASRFNLALPTEWNIIENYTRMFKLGGLSTAFKNSIIITVTSVVILIAISSTSAFILQRRKSRFTGLAYNMIILGLVIPGSIIPMFFISKFMHLTDIPQIAAILNLVVSQFPLAVFIYFGGFKGIPQQIDESAFIDGSSLLRLFTTIVFPLLKPVTATIVIISFMNIWNNFNLTLYFLNSPKTFTLTLTIYNFMSTYNSDWNLVFANVIVCSLPVIVVYFTLQKYIISGMTSGSIKG